MKTILLIALIYLMFPQECLSWDKADYYREAGWQVLHVVDWGQTLEIARNPDRYWEMNPIMGKHPSVGNVNFYMGLSSIAHAAVSVLLPEKIRPYWQWISIGVSGACVINNFNVGLGVKF